MLIATPKAISEKSKKERQLYLTCEWQLLPSLEYPGPVTCCNQPVQHDDTVCYRYCSEHLPEAHKLGLHCHRGLIDAKRQAAVIEFRAPLTLAQKLRRGAAMRAARSNLSERSLERFFSSGRNKCAGNGKTRVPTQAASCEQSKQERRLFVVRKCRTR
jgi:hypothetical protein